MRLRSLLLSVVFVTSPAFAADWPQWRGPARDGISAEKNLLDTWPKDGPKLLWQVDKIDGIGTGYGSPAVVGDKLFIIGGDGLKKDAKEFVTCLSVKDGKPVWQTKLETAAGDFSDGWGGGPRATPTVDGDRLYALGVTGDLVCLSTDKGEVKWKKNLKADLGGSIPQPWWGHSESPLVDGDNLICTPGGKGGITALNKKTGEVVWVCKEITDNPGYSSVVVADVGGVKQYVQQTMKSAVGVRATDGKLLWKAGEISRSVAVIPSPIIADGYAFFTSGYGAGCECYKLEKDGDGTKATKVYSKNKVVANHHGGVVRVGDHVYGHSDAAGGWVCFPFKSGGDEPVWKNAGVGKGACSLADGHLYCVSEKTGTVALVKPSEKAYEEVSRFTIPKQSEARAKTQMAKMTGVWAHPVIADGKLFVRDFDLLYVYDVSKPKS